MLRDVRRQVFVCRAFSIIFGNNLANCVKRVKKLNSFYPLHLLELEESEGNLGHYD